MLHPQEFDVIVVGGGHAGTEAALAAARMGCTTLLLTHNIETLGQMSCNPSIGGIGKGHLVKEIDALGGAMAAATDEAGIQFRILNGSKGPAVRATRAQADRVLYRAAIRQRLENQPRLWLFQQAVDDLMLDGERVIGAVTQIGLRFRARAVVLTAGTFLDGRIHVGLQNYSAGRAGDPPAVSLSARLKELKLPQGRLKTGTPPRLDGRSIDFARLTEQPGDGMPGVDGSPTTTPMPVFSFLGRPEQHPRQLPCWITHTNQRTHAIIRSGFDRSPMFTGVIEGVGPRYCPSIEDKINRFADKGSHQIFLEPEGLTTHEFYPNGISTSLPFDIQLAAVRSMVGLEQAHILRPGYAIEYDYFDPRELQPSFETRAVEGAVLCRPDQRHHGLRRSGGAGSVRRRQCCLAGAGPRTLAAGATRGLPGRARRRPRQQGRDRALPHVYQPRRIPAAAARGQRRPAPDRDRPRLGLVDDARWDAFCRKRDRLAAELQRLRSTWVRPQTVPAADAERLLGKALEHEYSLADLLRRPGIGHDAVCELAAISRPEAEPVSRETWRRAWGDREADAVIEQAEIALKYAGYIDKQNDEVERAAAYEHLQLPEDLDYGQVTALSFEVRQKLTRHRPATLGQAARLSGMTPAAVSLLLVHLKKGRFRGFEQTEAALRDAAA